MIKIIKIIISLPSLFLIGIYKYAISPFTPASCRHYPSCSTYASEAIQRHGIHKGSTMSIKRILKCHPWGTQGYDPVPQFKFKIYKKGIRQKFNLHESLQRQTEV